VSSRQVDPSHIDTDPVAHYGERRKTAEVFMVADQDLVASLEVEPA
jgi:hypothetical protein